MATVTKIPLSASTNGAGVKVVATATPGTLIHTATATTGQVDEIWLWAFNGDGAANSLITVEYGDAELPVTVALPLKSASSPGLIPVIPGFLLQGGATVRVYASAANTVKIHGFVNRITF